MTGGKESKEENHQPPKTKTSQRFISMGIGIQYEVRHLLPAKVRHDIPTEGKNGQANFLIESKKFLGLPHGMFLRMLAACTYGTVVAIPASMEILCKRMTHVK